MQFDNFALKTNAFASASRSKAKAKPRRRTLASPSTRTVPIGERKWTDVVPEDILQFQTRKLGVHNSTLCRCAESWSQRRRGFDTLHVIGQSLVDDSSLPANWRSHHRRRSLFERVRESRHVRCFQCCRLGRPAQPVRPPTATVLSRVRAMVARSRRAHHARRRCARSECEILRSSCFCLSKCHGTFSTSTARQHRTLLTATFVP